MTNERQSAGIHEVAISRCHKCGTSGIHACLGRHTPQIGEEERATLRAALARVFVRCDWPEGGRFTVIDDPDPHKPCYLVMPRGGAIPLAHHAENGVDQARAQFIAGACNSAIDLLTPIAVEKEEEPAARFDDEYIEKQLRSIAAMRGDGNAEASLAYQAAECIRRLRQEKVSSATEATQ